MRNLIFILFLVPTLLNTCFAQDSKDIQIYKGQILSSHDGKPVALAHVINYTKKWTAISDSSGYFKIWGVSGDSLNISAIGFHYFDKYSLPTKNDSAITIYLDHKIYKIREARISHLGSYQQFQQKVVNLKLPKVELNKHVEKIIKHVEYDPVKSKLAVGGPVSLAYNLFSKEAKDLRKYQKLEKEKPEKEKMYNKFNEHIIKNLTNLSLEEAVKLMKYCNFEKNYILNTPDYDLYSEILKKFEEFKKQPSDSLQSE
ncbi:MAG: hypothetical protein MI739_02695 [Bacteroidales bacterium]|nr:hypothetical protein [Bacteroidales bacterium]